MMVSVSLARPLASRGVRQAAAPAAARARRASTHRAAARAEGERLNIVFAGFECAPYSKTGGLGDVMQSLPKALVRRGHRVMVWLPRRDLQPSSSRPVALETPPGATRAACAPVSPTAAHWLPAQMPPSRPASVCCAVLTRLVKC